MIKTLRTIDKFISLKALVVFLLLLAIYFPAINILGRYYEISFASKSELIRARDKGIILLDRNGKQFFSFGDVHRKRLVRLSEISPNVQKALIASEDREFYRHSGFSLRGIARSALLDIKHGELLYGGSTITQQLVKNTVLNSDKNLTRKALEVIMALKMETRFSKNDILEMYLNTVYFGENSYGIEQAANTYFNKPASKLTSAESALLVALVKSPSSLSPLSNNRTAAIVRQQNIIKKMREQNLITQDQEQNALAEKLYFTKENAGPQISPHFALYVRDQLSNYFGTRLKDNLISVTTTLDLDKQAATEELLKNHVASLRTQHVSNGAIISLAANTHEVLAMAGSADWQDTNNGKINMATSPRQSGSAFKPIVYATAFSDGILTPSSIIEDKKTTFPGDYTPKNYDLKYHGKVTARTALANSLNIPAVQTVYDIGPARVVDMANRFGIRNLSQYATSNLSIALGTEQISLLDLTNAYATLASEGQFRSPKSILEITGRDGKKIETPRQSSYQALDPRVAFLISTILSDSQARARIFGRSLTIDRPAAVKTGTTSDYKDAWTIGYTPSLTVGVWIGNSDNSPMFKTPGAEGAAPLWKQLMKTYLANTPPQDFQMPQGIITERVCRSTGLLARSGSGASYKEYFLPGTEPTEYCAIASPSPDPSPSPASFEPSQKPGKPTPNWLPELAKN